MSRAHDAAEDVVATTAPAPATENTRESSVRAAILVGVLAAAFALIPRATKGCEGASVDEDAPDFKARVVANPTEANQTSIELSSLRGHPVVLDFWATWCGPCQAEAPIVNTIAERYKDRGLAVIGVNTSDEDGLAERFVRKKGLGFPIVFDERNSIAKQYNVSNLPTLVVISKTGKIVAVRHGVTSDAALDDIVRKYL